MTKEQKRAEKRGYYDQIFRNVDEDERQLVDHLIEEVVYLETEMEDLKKYQFIAFHPTKPGVMRMTPAAKLYKEYSNSYMNALRILMNVLRKVESNAQDDLLKKLEEFS